jgi:hypothetical protein
MSIRERYKDLKLSYEAALHGVQSAIAYKRQKMAERERREELKHHRVGIDSAHCSQAAIAMLLIEKGIFSEAELNEALRLLVNNELALYETEARVANPGTEIKFR